jgi:hypothetical protein
MIPIKAYQSILGPDPEVAVNGLPEGKDSVSGQPAFHIPVLDIVIDNGFTRVQGKQYGSAN